jgi:hypothetical protein
MSTLERVSTLVKYQLPDFIRDDHPIFVEFLEKYYEFLEQPSNPIYELKRFQENFDVDKTRESFLQYFKNKILPSFPDTSELSTERIIKAARDFYAKKGTPDSFKFLFRVLYGKELEVLFPKLQILKASDGKWVLPQAFRISLSEANKNIDVNLLKKHKAYGSISRASCIIESAYRTIDVNSNLEIIELYVSNVNRTFRNGEYLEFDYFDANGVKQTFSEKIIGSLKSVDINPNYRGSKYNSGDPVVINGGLDTASQTRRKGRAVVGNVTSGSISSVAILNPGYAFRVAPDSFIDVISPTGVNANVVVSAVNTTSAITFVNATDAILPKASVLLNAANFGFANIGTSTISTTIQSALTFSSISVYPIEEVTVYNSGDFFEAPPTLDVISTYDSDYGITGSFITVPSGDFTNYDWYANTIQFVGGSYSSTNDWYKGWRLVLNSQYREIIAYDGATKTATLARGFEPNININILSKTLYLDPRPLIKSMGRIAKVEVLNGGSGYSSGDTVSFIGTGYDATATLTVSSGVITAVTLTNRGEGYSAAPTVQIGTSGGADAIFDVIMMSEGEKLRFDIATTSIGQIRDLVLLDKGSDYTSKPNVSLKVYDIVIDPILETQYISENDIVYQGADVNTAVFKATVDEYFRSNNIIRVFDYSGSLFPGVNLVVYKTSTANINTIPSITSIKYGDGRAKANAQFLDGVIKYAGFYLSTDGHLSSDKKLQDNTKYHNFSYSLISESSYSEYVKTVLDSLHPAGTKLVPVHEIKTNPQINILANINTQAVIASSNAYNNNCNVDFNSTVVTGTGEYFDLIANTGDLIIINSDNVYRSFAKVITGITNNNSLNIESACVIVGEGRAKVTGNAATLTISGNTNQVISYITVNDQLKINVNNNVLTKTINSISGNVITLNSNTGIITTNTNLVYLVYPKLNAALYNVVRTIS